jgi:hypothetical protein
MSDTEVQTNKPHHKKKTKLKQKKEREQRVQDEEQEGDEKGEKAKARNQKAFSYQSHVAAERRFRRLGPLF